MNRVACSKFTHVQSQPATEWVVQHNLGSNGGQGLPIVDVFINVDGSLVRILTSVEMIDKQNIRISFSEAQSGRAVIVV